MNPASGLPLAVWLPEYHATSKRELFIYAFYTNDVGPQNFFALYTGNREVLIRKVKGVNIVPLRRCKCRASRLRESGTHSFGYQPEDDNVTDSQSK